MDLDAALQDYREGMAASVAVKDNNAFWPRGIPALSYPSAHLAAADLLGQMADGVPAQATLHPTSVLCLLLYLTHGIRRARMPAPDRLKLARELLRFVIVSRSGQLRPTGPILLRRWLDLPGAAAILGGARRDQPGYVSACFQLGGQGFALGESAFFFAHRFLTERHGPYQVADNLFTSCRHIRNLDACRDVWPEVATADTELTDIAIWTFIETRQALTFTYDMWGNPVFMIDPLRDCRGAAAYARLRSGDCVLLDPPEIAAWQRKLARMTSDVLKAVANASEKRLAEAMRSIMAAIIMRELGIATYSTAVSASPEPPHDFRVSGPPRWLADYYDWRADLPTSSGSVRN
jgi:hypothetical protein